MDYDDNEGVHSGVPVMKKIPGNYPVFDGEYTTEYVDFTKGNISYVEKTAPPMSRNMFESFYPRKVKII